MMPKPSARSAVPPDRSSVRPAIRSASTTIPPSLPVVGEPSAPLDANDGAQSGTTPAIRPATRRRVTRRPVRDLTALNARLSERDTAVLRSVAEHRFLTATQIQVLHFGEQSEASGRRVTQRVCARLRRHHLLGTLPQRVGGIRAGSAGLNHYVDDLGLRLLDAERGTRTRRRFHEPSARFVDHLLAIADVHVALVAADRDHTVELVACTVEPVAWRDYTGLGGARVTLKPDLYIETAVPPGNDYLDSYFIEIDRGSESIPTVLKKCREYETYRRSGREQQQSDGAFPVVVWSMSARDPDRAQRRRNALGEAIAADRHLTPALFRIVAPDQLTALMQKGGRS